MKVEQPPITAWKGCLVVKTDVLTLDGNATMETYLLARPYGPALLPMADASSARKPEEILPHVGTWCSLALEWLEELFDAQKKEEEVTDAGI